MLRTAFLGFIALFLMTTTLSAQINTDAGLQSTIESLNKISSLDALNAKLKEFNGEKETAKKLVKYAAKLAKDAKDADKPLKHNTTLLLGRLALNVKDLESAETIYAYSFADAEKLQSGKRMIEIYESLLEIYWEQKKFDKAEELSKKLLDSGSKEIEEVQEVIIERMILTKAKAGDTDEAIRMADNLINLTKGSWYYVKLKADVYREGDKLEDAIGVYLEALEKADKQLETDKKAKGAKAKDRVKAMEMEIKKLKYMLTGVYVDNKEVDKSAELLEKLIKDDPENGTFYNDLGFIWADNGLKLEESEKMVRKALEMDAKAREKALKEGKITEEIAKEENAAYLDSLGWVLYKQGKYEEAYKYLDKASQNPDEGNHIEIWDHVADCLVKLGKKKEAVEVWTKALKLDDVSKRDIERRKKVTAKLKKLQEELAK
jgi:tetratricopeptide (TPR) repeat protein